jgi:hypothetical protein
MPQMNTGEDSGTDVIRSFTGVFVVFEPETNLIMVFNTCKHFVKIIFYKSEKYLNCFCIVNTFAL